MSEPYAAGAAATVEKALVLIEVMSNSRVPCGVTQLSRMVGFNKTTVHRLLETLRRHGYVRQTETGHYLLTPKLWELGVGVIQRFSLHSATPPFLREAVAETGEAAFLAIPGDDHALIINRVASGQPLQIVAPIGARLPLHASALGKASIVDWNEQRIKRYARSLPACTEHTVVEADKLIEEVEEVRRRGYAVAVDEFQIGVSAVAAPIRDFAGEVVGAFAIAGPTSRLSSDELVLLGPKAAMTASRISSELGFRPGGFHDAAE